MTYRVRTETRATSLPLDGTVWILESNLARAEVWPALGFNCYRWRVLHRGEACELLYAAPNLFEELAPTRSGFPILFPFPNRIRDGRFSWAGKQYALPGNDATGKNAIHGFACRRPWRIVNHGTDEHSAWLSGEFHGSRDAPDCRTLWPADYRMQVTYRLTESGLRIDAKVDNPDRVSLPFGLGYHPYFRMPFREGVPAQSYQVTVPARSYWELDEQLPTGTQLTATGPRNLLSPRAFDQLQADDVFTNLEKPPADGAGDLRECGSIREPAFRLRLACSPDFRELVVFTPPHRQAVCLEPYTCVTDAINLQQRGIDAGLQVLGPGTSWQGVVECTLDI